MSQSIIPSRSSFASSLSSSSFHQGITPLITTSVAAPELYNSAHLAISEMDEHQNVDDSNSGGLQRWWRMAHDNGPMTAEERAGHGEQGEGGRTWRRG